MDKKEYCNSVTSQVFDLKELAPIQVEKCFHLERLRAMLPPETAGKVRRVIVTGCGDSYSAAVAMRKGLRQLSGLRQCHAPDIVDFCSFYSDEKINKGYMPEQVLFVGISFSGSSQKVAEALEKANQKGLHSLLITRTPDSLAGKKAGGILDVQTPEGCNTPGLRSYFASLMALAALGAYLGVCNGSMTEERFLEIGRQCVGYVEKTFENIRQIDEQMFQEARRMKNLRLFEVIADGNEGGSAQFVEQKFIECGGVYCDHTNSEEFAHISFFMRSPQRVGTVILINQADPSLNRMRDTVDGCLKQNRPTLVVTDMDPRFFALRKGPVDTSVNIYGNTPIGADSADQAGTASVCRLPKAPEQWMSPLVDFIPGSLLAGYQAAINEHLFFDGRYDFRAQAWIGR